MSSTTAGSGPSNEAIQQLYDAWLLKFHKKDWPLLDELEVGEPNWNKLWKRVWKRYDALEGLRKERHARRLSWQSVYEDYRLEIDSRRQHEWSSNYWEDWKRYPLGIKLETILGNKIRHSNRGWGVALKRASRLQSSIKEEPMFMKSFSPAQQASWTLLEEWWLAKYQDPNLSAAVRASMRAAASSSTPRWKQFLDGCSQKELYQVEKSSLIKQSLYHSTMFRLSLLEFHPGFWESYRKELYLDQLHRVRKDSLAYASAQRIGYSSYAIIKGKPNFKATPYIGSNQEACPWLQKKCDEPEEPEMPLYLWDIIGGRTIRTHESAEYWCISHTWGRWRREPSVSIEGVPWLVPQNDRFVVQDLPGHLRLLQQHLGKPRFIWIDLFCIPQDGSFEADEEINRQALIFQNSSRCLAWQNDIIDWSVTRDALAWLGLSYLRATSIPRLYDIDKALPALYTKSQSCGELFPERDALERLQDEVTGFHQARNDHDVAYVDRLRHPATWFSSLWTLQEAILCPDLLLIDRNWKQLTDLGGILIPLNALFRIVDFIETIWNNGEAYGQYDGDVVDYIPKLRESPSFDKQQYVRWPRAARQLRELGILTRMKNLFDAPSPTTVLVAASLRECTGYRAPAIMSALGATDWYDTAEAAGKDLVFSSYPLAFVRETASKLGATFYLSMAYDQEIPSFLQSFRGEYRGSMLPFGFDNAETRVVSRHFGVSGLSSDVIYEVENHRAVYSWEINLDGSVSISHAGILASSKSSKNSNLEMCFSIMSPRSITQKCTIKDLVSKLPKARVIYAVSLLKDGKFQYGIILRRINKKILLLKEKVVRIGIFFTEILEFPPVSYVDWLAI